MNPMYHILRPARATEAPSHLLLTLHQQIVHNKQAQAVRKIRNASRLSSCGMGPFYQANLTNQNNANSQVPWAGLAGKEMHRRVCLQDERPAMPPSAPHDLVELATACWCPEPESRLTCDQILDHLAGVRTA